MPLVSDLPECPLCFGRLLPLSVCRSCNTVAVRGEVRDVSPDVTCEDCGATNPSYFVCGACHSRFPYDDVVKPEGATCPSCRTPVPPRAERCPNCHAILPFAATALGRTKRRIRGEYTEDDVREVSRIPNLGRQRSEALCKAGYNRLWKIRQTPEEAIAAVEGVGTEHAAKVRESLRFLLVVGQQKTKDEVLSEEYQCPLCGTATSLFATRCHDCGAMFDPEELDEEFRKEIERDEEKGLLAYYDVRLLEDPDDLALLYARAVLLLAMGHPAETLSALDATLQLAPGHWKSLQAKARALVAAKGFGAASQVLRNTLEEFPPEASHPPSAGEGRAPEAPTREGVAGRDPKVKPPPTEEEEEAETAFASLGALAESSCPECGEPIEPGALICSMCGHRLAPEEGPSQEPAFEGEHLLDDLERAIAGDDRLPPPPLEPEVTKTVINGKRVMLAFLSKIPGVSRRAAEGVSGFFQDLEQVGLADVIDIADIPGVAPAEARLIKVAVARHIAPPGPVKKTAKAARASPEVAAPEAPPKPAQRPPEAPTRRPTGAPAPRPSGFELRRGMVNGRGHVNGRGRVNGIINGTGFVNGVSVAQLHLPRRSLMPRYITIGVSLVMLFGFVIVYFLPGDSGTGLRVDGQFDDWSRSSAREHLGGTVSGNPSVNIVGSWMHVERTTVFLRVQVEGAIFANPTAWQTMYAFLDVDGNDATGYALGDLGADYLVRVSGLSPDPKKPPVVEEARLLHHDPIGRTQDDWSGFTIVGTVSAEVGHSSGAEAPDAPFSDLELAVSTDALEGYGEFLMRVRFALDDNAGQTSHTVVPLQQEAGGLLVEMTPQATTLGGGVQPFLVLTFTSLGGVDLTVKQVQLITRGGARFSPDPVPEFVVSDRPVPRTVTVDTTGVLDGTLVTAIVTDVTVEATGATERRGRPFAIVGSQARAYVSQPPTSKVIDGLFADWPAPMPDSDAIQVQRRSLNILSRDGAVVGNQVFLYARLGGDALESGLIPEKPFRPTLSGPGGGPSAPAAPPPPLVGQDYIRFFVDTDAAAPGGFEIGGVYADHLLEVRGRGGRVTNATVYRVVGSSWAPQAPLDWGMDADEIEVGATIAGAAFNGTQFVVVTADWAGVADRTDSIGTRGALGGGTRGSTAPPAVMDVSGNGPFWFRDTNHASENACTYNKVASSTKGPGPVKTITLNTGESACWYADETTGKTIPAGVWETLIDVSISGADYSVLIEIWNLDTNTVAETIQSCLDQTDFGDDRRCFLDPVASKTLTATQVVRLVFAHSAASGTVSIDYDDSDTTGDSRATLPIPEFPDLVGSSLAVILPVIAVLHGRRRRKLRA